MDELYFLDGYYEGKYFVYTANVIVGFTPYIAEGYLNQDFFEDRGSQSSLIADLTKITISEFSANLVAAFTFTAQASIPKTATAAFNAAFTMATISTRTIRSSVTLSSIANLSAQSDDRTRSMSSSLTSLFTQSSSAQVFRNVSATLSAVATQTSASVISARAQAAWNSAFSPTITANASVSNGSDISAIATVTALVGVIKQFPAKYNLGARRLSGVLRQQLSGMPSSLDIQSNGFTASIWARRETVGNYFQTIWMPMNPSGDAYDKVALVFDNNNVRLRSQYDADEPGATWDNIAPMNSDWHHYVIYKPSANTWQLWIDGVSKGTQNYYATMRGSEFNNTQYIQYGSGMGVYPVPGYDESTTVNTGISVAQGWFGSIPTTQTFPLNEFYSSGYRDLGTTGRGPTNALPVPYIYSLLSSGTTSFDTSAGTAQPASTPIGLPSAQAQFTLSALPQNVLVVAANLSSAFTQTAIIGQRSSGQAGLTASSTLTATAIKTVGITAAITSAATIAAINQRVRFASAGLSSEFTFTTTITKVQPASGSLTSNSTLSAQADNRTRIQSAALTSNFTVTAEIDDRTRDAISLEVGAFALDLVYTVIRPQGAALTASFTQITDAQKVVVTFAAFTAAFAVTSTIYRALIAEAHLTVTGFQLTQGDVLNFDPCREIKVDQETRLARLRPENRLLIVESETRTLKVAQETRVLKVDFETRVNILQC
jgi:hypothetical protein